MNTDELATVCATINGCLGVFPADRLPPPQANTTFICNTKSLGDKGEHWVAIGWDHNSKGNYFCSFGQAPPPEIHAYLAEHDWQRNDRQLQNTWSDLCGQYCVCYVYFFNQDWTLSDFTNLLHRDDNDALVSLLFDRIKL